MTEPTLIEWLPANGQDPMLWTSGLDAQYRLLAAEGLEPVAIEPVLIKSPNQPGSTAVDVIVPPRVVTLQGLLQATTAADAWALRALAATALSQQPTRLGEAYALGRLRVTIADRQPLEVEALARSAHLGRPKAGQRIIPCDVEFLAPNPYWREIADTQMFFSAAGGFDFSVEFPLEMTSNNVELEIDNQGDVDAPIVVRMYGDITTGRIINETTGETLEITGNVPATKYLEINTGFGEKRIEEVTIATGARVSVMDRLNLALADFWSLRPGLNIVRFEADVNVSGRAELYWRQRYAGI